VILRDGNAWATKYRKNFVADAAIDIFIAPRKKMKGTRLDFEFRAELALALVKT
jgi:hypothetical protein